MRQTDQQSAVALALDENAVAGALAALLRLAVGAAGRLLDNLGDSLGLGDLFLGLRVQNLLDFVTHSARGNLAGADGGKQVLELLVVKLLRHGVERTRGSWRRDAIPALAQVLGQYIAAGRSVIVFGRGGKVTADL